MYRYMTLCLSSCRSRLFHILYNALIYLLVVLLMFFFSDHHFNLGKNVCLILANLNTCSLLAAREMHSYLRGVLEVIVLDEGGDELAGVERTAPRHPRVDRRVGNVLHQHGRELVEELHVRLQTTVFLAVTSSFVQQSMTQDNRCFLLLTCLESTSSASEYCSCRRW